MWSSLFSLSISIFVSRWENHDAVTEVIIVDTKRETAQSNGMSTPLTVFDPTTICCHGIFAMFVRESSCTWTLESSRGLYDLVRDVCTTIQWLSFSIKISTFWIPIYRRTTFARTAPMLSWTVPSQLGVAPNRVGVALRTVTKGLLVWPSELYSWPAVTAKRTVPTSITCVAFSFSFIWLDIGNRSPGHVVFKKYLITESSGCTSQSDVWSFGILLT